MMAELGKSKRPKRKEAAKWDRMLIRAEHLAAVLAALVAILHGTGLL